jgi:penicillin amidase
MKRLRLGAALLVLAAVMHLGARGLDPLPPLGGLLDPVYGAWANGRLAALPSDAAAEIPGLEGAVEVVYDVRGVPHITAGTYDDLMRALGFVVARDRLFQLEMQTRFTAGTLSELFGAGAVDVDRDQRALGLVWSAEREFAALPPSGPIARAMAAFGEGVNAWIDGVDRKTLPFEYRLLDAWPARWAPEHSLYLARRMGYTLSYSRSEFRRRRAAGLIGQDATDALFGRHSPIQEPIQPGPRPAYPWFDRSPLPPPSPAVSAPVAPADGPRAEAPGATARPMVAGWFVGPDDVPPGVIGSNNWAVAPERSASGFALLAGDPHLDLTLPSIWYEVHLVIPGEVDVYGVTIPGMPGIVIGFTRDVAWTLTNTGADVLDYYEEVLDDAARPSRYRVDGAWRDLERREEVYRGRDGAVVAVDTMYFTHRGPLVRDEHVPLSIRWTNLSEAVPYGIIAALGRAGSVRDVLAETAIWGPSAQNILTADRQGHIALRSTGAFPLRGAAGDGPDFLDGATTATDWTGAWPVERYPTGFRPAQGYLASANQEPLDPADDSTYLGVEWQEPWRAMRINRLLRESSTVSVDDFRRFQTDPGNERAELFVPLFLAAARSAHAGRDEDASSLDFAAALLAEWGRVYAPQDTVAVLFEAAMDELENRVWDELLPPPDPERRHDRRRRVATPSEAVLWRALVDSTETWCDDRRTPAVEPCRMLLAQSLAAAYTAAVEQLGKPNADTWRWDRHQTANVWHLLRQRALSALDLPVQGGPGTLNPSSGSGTHGASWRMIVELGEELRAWVTYPGGQSGNPASPWYDDRIPEWVAGELQPVLFPRTGADLSEEQVAARLTLEPAP